MARSVGVLPVGLRESCIFHILYIEHTYGKRSFPQKSHEPMPTEEDGAPREQQQGQRDEDTETRAVDGA